MVKRRKRMTKRRPPGHAKGSPRMTPIRARIVRMGTDGKRWISRKLASGKYGWKRKA